MEIGNIATGYFHPEMGSHVKICRIALKEPYCMRIEWFLLQLAAKLALPAGIHDLAPAPLMRAARRFAKSDKTRRMGLR